PNIAGFVRALPDLILILLMAFAVLALHFTSLDHEKLRFPYFVTAILVCVYCLWPTIAEFLPRATQGSLLTLTIFLASICSSILLIGYLWAHVLKNTAKRRANDSVRTAPTTTRPWLRRALIITVLLSWGIVVHAQAAAVLWAIQRWQHATYTILDVC